MDTVNDLQKNCAEKLQALKPFISSTDKKDAAKLLNCDLATVYRYLNGDVRDIRTGTSLLSFFTTIAEARKTVLA